jgi:hypothetical protein
VVFAVGDRVIVDEAPPDGSVGTFPDGRRVTFRSGAGSQRQLTYGTIVGGPNLRGPRDSIEWHVMTDPPSILNGVECNVLVAEHHLRHVDESPEHTVQPDY